jgi:hypothetical protein
MHSRSGHLACALGTLAMGLVLALAATAQAADAIDDPVRQPHLKSWSNIIPNATRRFVVLGDFNNDAVLDRETGLVWEKSPDRLLNYTWIDALALCANKAVGAGKDGESPRLPS